MKGIHFHWSSGVSLSEVPRIGRFFCQLLCIDSVLPPLTAFKQFLLPRLPCIFCLYSCQLFCYFSVLYVFLHLFCKLSSLRASVLIISKYSAFMYLINFLRKLCITFSVSFCEIYLHFIHVELICNTCIKFLMQFFSKLSWMLFISSNALHTLNALLRICWLHW